MKVKITNETKREITVAQLAKAKEIVKALANPDNEEPNGTEEYFKVAVRAASGDNVREVLKVEARIARNCGVWDAMWGEDTEDLDVWIEGVAETWSGIYKVGAYLTDIWNISAEDKQTNKMYIRKFVWVKD